MISRPLIWVVTVVSLPLVAPPALLAQATSGMRSSELGRPTPQELIGTAAPKPSRRGRSRTDHPQEEPPPPANDWNPHYLRGKAHFLKGEYDEACVELEQNVADCDRVDFEAMSHQNVYFEHIWNNMRARGQSINQYLHASNLQWIGAALAAQGHYDTAQTRFLAMAQYAERCFSGRLSTFEGCACQGVAFLYAARGRYREAVERYRLALAHIEGNTGQVGLPPAPCVAMVLVALADVELARGRGAAAAQYLARAGRVQEAQRVLGIGPSPSDLAAYLIIRAQLRYCESRYPEASRLYVKALASIQSIREHHPLSAYCLDGLGDVELAQGQLDKAEDHFRESLAVRRSSLGERHREVAYSLHGLARVAAARGKSQEAEVLADLATSILTQELGRSHPDLVAIARLNKVHDQPPRPAAGAGHARARFLAIPTLLTVGWQVLHLTPDWRIVEDNIRRREVKEARTAHHAAMAAQAATTGRNAH